jgi:hypothetical protein
LAVFSPGSGGLALGLGRRQWDDALTPAITAAGVETEEELVLDLLLEDVQTSRYLYQRSEF